MKIKCMIDRTRYKDKPKDWQIGKVQNSLKGTEIDIKELSELLIAGCSFRPAFLNGKKQEDWISQQIIALDFDNNTTIEQELNRCRELNILPTFGYTSFSHAEEHHKFRLVFCVDKVIKDYNIAKQIQNILMYLFNTCDKQCSNLSRLYFGGKQLIYEGHNNKINYKELLNKYEGLIDYNNRYIYNTNYHSRKNPFNNIDNINYNIQAIKEHNVDYLKSVLNVDGNCDVGLKRTNITIYNNTDILVRQKPPVAFTSDKEFYNFIDKIDLYNFLGVDGRIFNCIIPSHKDSKPSAGIIINVEGHYIYNCFGCGFTGGIIKVIEAISGCTRYHAIKFLKNIYNIKLETEWQKEQKEILEENIKYLMNNKMQEDYPELWKFIKPRVDKLILLNTYAKNNITSEDCTYNNYPIFFGSLNYFKELFNTNSKETTNKSVQLFAILNLIHKVKIEDLPKDMLNRAKEHQKKMGYNYMVNHYQITSYCYKYLKDAENKAKTLKENNFTMKGLSREWVIRTFGKDVANKIFPQFKNRNEKGTTKASDDRTNEIASIILSMINDKGYATEKEVIEVLQDKYGKTFAQVQLKRSLQELLEGYDLKRVRANKQIKEQLRITNKGYPFLLLRNNKKGVY